MRHGAVIPRKKSFEEHVPVAQGCMKWNDIDSEVWEATLSPCIVTFQGEKVENGL